MSDTVHLVTVVGTYSAILPHMLRHYQSLGVASFHVNVHLRDARDPVLEEVKTITAAFGCAIESTTVGDWQSLQQGLYHRPRERYPRDWFLLADADEFQVYPGDLRAILNQCDRWGCQYVRGCLVDRIACDGGFPKLASAPPVWEQFPLGAFLTTPVLGGDPRKVVAVKGALPLFKGQHHTMGGRACPWKDYYIPVHHFKWVEGITGRLIERAALLREQGAPHWRESQRFVDYFHASGGRINLEDPNLFIGACEPAYRHWEAIKRIALSLPVPRG